jgi:hypothetical protein
MIFMSFSAFRCPNLCPATLGQYHPQLPGTRKEVQEIAVELNTERGDIKLGLAARLALRQW